MNRYTQKPFPPYRYLPGKLPHPEIHPEGHSYGEKSPPSPRLPPDAWQQNELYLYGVDLFNHGYWWEAHEAWERCWLTTKKFDLPGQFLQGLIQFSAALLKLYGGSPQGFEKLYRESTQRLQQCCRNLDQNSVFMGLNLAEWLKNAENFRQTSAKMIKKHEDPLTLPDYPYLVLEEF